MKCATRRTRGQRRRGIALMLVLLVLAIVAAGSVALVRLRTTEALRSNTVDRMTLADESVHGVEPTLLAWLDTQAGDVVLPAEALIPAVVVLNDTVELSGHTVVTRVVAIDQCGLVPWQTKNGALRQQVDESVQRLWLAAPGGIDVGLDLVRRDSSQKSASVFPRFELPEPVAFPFVSSPEDISTDKPKRGPKRELVLPIEQSRSVACAVATHDGGAAILNANTAPLALLEQALRREGRDAIDLIRAARTRGERVVLPALPKPDQAGESLRSDLANRLLVVSESRAWAFQVEVSIDGVRRRWWLVATRDESAGWRIVQRLEVTE